MKHCYHSMRTNTENESIIGEALSLLGKQNILTIITIYLSFVHKKPSVLIPWLNLVHVYLHYLCRGDTNVCTQAHIVDLKQFPVMEIIIFWVLFWLPVRVHFQEMDVMFFELLMRPSVCVTHPLSSVLLVSLLAQGFLCTLVAA